MPSNQTLTTRSLLLGTAALAILAIMGCDPGEDRDDVAQPPSDLASTNNAAEKNATNNATNNATKDTRSRDQNVAGRSGESARAQIKPTSAGNAEGTVTFSAGEEGREMRVTVELKGLEPGSHGFHVHEVGDCSAPDASSAGGHFNPNDAPHGPPGAAEHHVGDMGNIEADADGQVSSELYFEHLAFSGPASVLQKAVVIHQNADDMSSQPSGDAGARVGCGVIRRDR